MFIISYFFVVHHLQLCELEGANCASVEYDGVLNMCYFYSDVTSCGAFQPNSDVIHVSRIDCGKYFVTFMK